MTLRICRLVAIAAFACCFFISARALAKNAYITNSDSNTVSVIDTASNTVTDTITGFSGPFAFGLFIQPEIAFSSLSATLVINGQQAVFTLDAFFGLGAGSSGINPPAQTVTLQVGPYTATIPAGSFRQLAYASTPVWAFKGTINDVSLLVEILALGDNSYRFFAAANPVNLTGVTNPVPVSFSIGNNAGSTSVIPFLTG